MTVVRGARVRLNCSGSTFVGFPFLSRRVFRDGRTVSSLWTLNLRFAGCFSWSRVEMSGGTLRSCNSSSSVFVRSMRTEDDTLIVSRWNGFVGVPGV